MAGVRSFLEPDLAPCHRQPVRFRVLDELPATFLHVRIARGRSRTKVQCRLAVETTAMAAQT